MKLSLSKGCVAVGVALVLGLAGIASRTSAQTNLHLLPGDTAVSAAAGDQSAPAIAVGDNVMLAVWTDNRPNPYPSGVYAWSEYETSRDIFGLRLDLAGNVLDSVPLAIVARRSNQNFPKISWNGAHWLVVYESVDVGGTGYYEDSLEAVRVSTSGLVLDADPIKLPGVRPVNGWAVASDSNNWVIVNQGAPVGNDIIAVRISAAGIVLDPPTRALVPAVNNPRLGGLLAYANGVFLFNYGDDQGFKLGRFDPNLVPLASAPLPPNVSFADLAANGTGFYAVWNRTEPNGAVRVVGSRLSTAGTILDGTGVNLSGSKEPSSYATTAVVWDGVNWRVTWGQLNTTWIARVSPAGTLRDPGSVSIAGVQTGRTAGTGGSVQLVWTESTHMNSDVFSANVSPANVAGPRRALSVGAPQQTQPDVASSGTGYILVYRSATSSQARVLAQPLDVDGHPLTAEPVELDAGLNINGPGQPNVAWNGSTYLVSWTATNGIVAQRISATGAKLDAAPFMVMSGCFGPTDVAALGSDFLVTGRKTGISIQYIFPVAARVTGAGTVPDPSPLVLGFSYLRTPPAVVALGHRWLVAWHRNVTHDDSACFSMGAFIDAGGLATPEFQIHGPFSTAGGNGIFEVGLGSSGDRALFVQSQELTSGVENDLLCRVIDTNGLAGPPINLTPWSGNQYRPRVAWDGAGFIVAYQDQKNRIALNALDPLDARSDLFAMRVSPTGVKRDPQGFVLSARPTAETDPVVCAQDGRMLVAGALLIPDYPFANYRIACEVRPATSPLAVINVSTNAGDIPLTVRFNSGGGFGALFSHAWDFGDGAKANGANPSHTFTVAGEHLVTLTTSDELGRQTTQAQVILATKSNQVPVAVATADKTAGNAPLDVMFSAAGSYDPDGFIGNLEWEFSDGGTFYGSPAFHTFSTVGTHTAILRCFDARGGIGTTNITIVVGGLNLPPLARASATPASGNAPLTVQFSSAGSMDPDGTLAEYYWTFGDAFGTHSFEPNPTYRYDYAGTYSATLTVRDNNNASHTDTVTITVGQNPATSIRSTAINLSAKVTRTSAVATGQVTVRSGGNTAVNGASVSIVWTKPDGSTVAQTAATGTRGVATFTTTGHGGSYSLAVLEVGKNQLTFDRANSVLIGTIDTAARLNAARAVHNLVLTWPTNVDGLVLQSAPVVGALAPWTNVPQTPLRSGTNFAVTVSATNGAAIYRLAPP